MLKKLTVLTDADQGLGINIAKNLFKRCDGDIYFTSRDEEKGKEVVNSLKDEGLQLKYHQLDISDRHSMETFRDYVQKNYSGIDMFIINVAYGNGIKVCDTYEKVVKVINDYYYHFVIVQELLFPLLKNHSKLIYVSKQWKSSSVKNPYWNERLSMSHLNMKDLNDFMEWYLLTVRNGTLKSDDIVADSAVAPFRVANHALSILVSLQRKELQARSINVDFMYPSWRSRTRFS